MVSLVKNSIKKGAKIQNEYLFLLGCIMATCWYKISTLDKKPSHINTKRNNKLALKVGIQTYQILTNDDEVCIPSLSKGQ